MNYFEAIAYLDEHASYDVTGRIESPSLDRIQKLMYAMSDPHTACPWITVTGTNGKGSTSAMISALVAGTDLAVGGYNSPHIQRINERISRNGRAISDTEFAEAVREVATIEPLTGVRPSYYDLVTAAAFGFFAQAPIDIGVLEVGVGGRWDSTNVADASVAVVTNIGMDHMEFLGPTRAHIAAEKAGIIKAESVVVIGETDEDLWPIFIEQARSVGASDLWKRGVDFDCVGNDLAVGGRLLTISTPAATYSDIFVPLHGMHQGENAAIALAAAEAFFGSAMDPEVVNRAFGDVVVPGRFEIMSRHPLVIIDGAHNPAGAAVAAQTLADDFLSGGDLDGEAILVVGQLVGRDPDVFLDSLDAQSAKLVVCTEPPSARALSCFDLAAAAKRIGCTVSVEADYRRAINTAIATANPNDAVLITGSLYLAGAARTQLYMRN